jgi:tetratricopeptide (TPR) repeat protein
MPLFYRQSDALSAALRSALSAAESRTESIKSAPSRAQFYATLAWLRQLSGDTAGAKTTREKALTVSKKVPADGWGDDKARLAFAVSLARAGDRASADEILNAALKRADEEKTLSTSIRGEVTSALHELGDDQQAREVTRQTIEKIAPGMPDADEGWFHLAVYDLALFGDPDGAEALLPKVKDPWERWSTFREIARLRKADRAKGAAALKRGMGIWLPSKEKRPSNVPGLVSVMDQIGQTAEAKALLAKLPALFPKKEDRTEVLKAQALGYALLKSFGQALTAADAISDKGARLGAYYDLADPLIAADDLKTYEILLKRLDALLPASNPDRPGLLLLLDGARVPALSRQGKQADAVRVLQRVTDGLIKLPAPEVSVGLLTAILQSAIVPAPK